MQEDIAAIKKGQTPAGFKIEKESEIGVKAPEIPVGPKITPPPSMPGQHVELGRLEKSKLLPNIGTPGLSPIQPTPLIPKGPGVSLPSLSIPTGGNLAGGLGSFVTKNIKKIIIYGAVAVAGFIATAFLIPYFASRPSPSPSPTPIVSRKPSPTPVSIESYFSSVKSINLSLNQDFVKNFSAAIDSHALVTTIGPALYKVNDATGSKSYSFSEFMSGLTINVPSTLLPSVDDQKFYLTVLYKADNKISYGFMVKLKDTSSGTTGAKGWEASSTNDLKFLLQYDPSKAASIDFLDNVYNGVPIRYRNFPDINSTIDYAIVPARNGETYLVVTNSREHMYSVIDRIK
jgi:hypothetical protein